MNNVEYEKLARFHGKRVDFARGFSIQVLRWRIPFVLRSIYPACFHQLTQYLGGHLRHSAVSTDHLNKPIF